MWLGLPAASTCETAAVNEVWVLLVSRGWRQGLLRGDSEGEEAGGRQRWWGCVCTVSEAVEAGDRRRHDGLQESPH